MTNQARVRPPSHVAPLLHPTTFGGYAAALIIVGAAYYLSARLGLSISLVERNVTPLWPPTGVAVVAYLLIGRSMWPAVAIAAFVVNLPISSGPLAAAVTSAGNTLAAVVAATLLLRVGFRRQLDRRRDALAIVFLGALASMLISATIGATTLVVSDAIPAGDFLPAWAVWWTGDALGVLTVAPFLLCLPLFWEQHDWSRADWLEEIVILLVVATVSVWAAFSTLEMAFLVLPVLGWAAWRLQLRAAAPAALIASLVVTWATARGHGGFDRGPLLEQMLALQAFNASVALISFFFAALVTERIRAAAALEAAAAELEERVQERTAELSSANARLLREIHERSEAEEQLSREEARALREHHIAETLQRSLLPEQLPDIPDVALAARYLPATGDMEVGGDWYDVVQLPGGLIGMAIGDVVGHGLHAAASMGQLRMALRAYALQDPSPRSVMRGLHRLMRQLPSPEMATLIYLVFDPETRQVRYSNAGHPPALLIANGSSTYLLDGLAPPVGVTADDLFIEASRELNEGSTLLLYTDGLVERRGVSIDSGLDRLRTEATEHGDADLEELCDRLLSTLVEPGNIDDDIAVVALRLQVPGGAPLTLTLPADPVMLAPARRALRGWLREYEIEPTDENEIVIAFGEACANVTQHAYTNVPGVMEIHARLVDESVELVVRDQGGWRPEADRGGGWGVSLIRALMDSVEVDRGVEGTEVRMRRRVERGGGQ